MLYVKGPQMEFQRYVWSFNSGVFIAYICVEKNLVSLFIFCVIE